jgi:hypothetical protein
MQPKYDIIYVYPSALLTHILLHRVIQSSSIIFKEVAEEVILSRQSKLSFFTFIITSEL